MTPPRRDPLDDARRRLDEAAGALDDIRRLTGAVPMPGAPAVSASEAASQRVKSEALESARGDLRRMAADLEAAQGRGSVLLEEIRRLRAELAARPTAQELMEAHAAGESDAGRRAVELGKQVVVLQERVSLLSAEHIRLETLRRKAESFGADTVASRRALEETLRRDLLSAHAALDRAAAESGVRDAKAVTEIGEMRKRLDQALNRLHREDLARKQASAEDTTFKIDFEAAEAVIASLRRELSDQRADALGRERALELRVHELEQGLSEMLSPPIPPAGTESEEVSYPPMESALEPGWAKLIHLVKPPLQAAYGHLRRLSAGPMSAGQRAILRLTGSSLSQAADSLATIELALSDTPATTETSTVLPVLESAMASWEPVFRRRGIALMREVTGSMPDTPHDPEQLRLALHHVLRNALEALPRGATLRVHLRKSAADAAELEFSDDGPGYPFAWLERRFEPFASPRPGHAGLGLAAVRRALRRWGGDASASNAAKGRGARLTLTFASAPARPAPKT